MRWDCRKKCFCWCLLILVITTLTFLSLPYFFKVDRRAHVLLKDIGSYLERIEDLEDDIEVKLKLDPFKDLFDNKVRPTLDALISIKNQVAIYEKMERIPGGPTNFIQTALKVVDETDSKIFQYEHEYRLIIGKSIKSYNKLQLEFEDLMHEFYDILERKDEEALEGIGINLDGNVDETYKVNEDGETPAQVLYQLSELLERKEGLLGEMYKYITQYDIQEVEDIYGTEAEPISEELTTLEYEIQELIEDSAELLATIIPMVEISFKTIKQAIDDSLEQFYRSKERYEKIVDVMDEDSQAVRKRIENLKIYKRKEEF